LPNANQTTAKIMVTIVYQKLRSQNGALFGAVRLLAV